MKKFGWIFTVLVFSANLAYGGTVALLKSDAPAWKDIEIGQSQLSIGGTYRLRYEFQNEYNIKTYGTGDHEDFLLSRLRLNFNLRLWNLSAFVQLQDARIFGSSFDDSDFQSSNPYHDNMDIRQAYFDYEAGEKLEIKIGRQEIAFADRRIFGPGDWGNTGRYMWDAARLRFHNSLIDSHFLVGRYIIPDPDRWPNKHAPDPTAYANYTMIKNLPFDFDVFYVFKRDDHGNTPGEKGEGNLTSHSLGFRIDDTIGRLDYGITFARQFGRWGSDTLRSYGLATMLGYTLDCLWSPHVMVQFINGSGDDNPNDGIKGTFDGVFGGADTVLYGWMNMFFWSNTREYRLDLILSPTENISFRGEFHYFTLDEKKDAWYFPGNAQRRDLSGISGRELGHEVDLTFHYTLVKWFDVIGGYCFFVPGEFIKKTGPDPLTQWMFLQTEISF
jgi:hypothetical protein